MGLKCPIYRQVSKRKEKGMTRQEIINELSSIKNYPYIEQFTTSQLADELQYERCCNCAEYPEMDRMKHCNKCEKLIEIEE